MRVTLLHLQKLLFLLVVIVAWLSSSATSTTVRSQQIEPPLFSIWDARGKEGFIDASGKIVIAPQFDKVTAFSEGLAAIRIGDKWGYIDRTGKLVVSPRWKEVYPFSDGVAAIVDGVHGYSYTPLPEEGDGYSATLKACGYIDKSGRYVIEPSLDRKMTYCPYFQDGIAPVCFEPALKIFFKDFEYAGRCGYLDKSGKWFIKPQFESASYFSDGLALVRLRQYYDDATKAWLNDFAFINKAGNIVFDLKKYIEAHPFRECLARVSNRTGSMNFIDATGQLRFEVNSISSDDFSQGRALVQDPTTKLFGYVGQDGKWAIAPKYSEAKSFSDGIASVCTERHKCGYINSDGALIAEHGGESFRKGLALRHLYTRTIGPTPDFRNIYGYMNRSGKYVWVAPGGENFLGEKWWRENYVGPHVPSSFTRP
jgi:hypothetical protein